jgi:hypothetical protein
MKKTLLLTLSIFTVVVMQAQHTLFVEPFDSQTDLPLGWTNLDADGDTFMWYEDYYDGGTVLETYAVSASYNEVPLTPDNYLATPQIDLTGLEGPVILQYNIGIGDEEWPAEKYQITLSTTTCTAEGFTNTLFEEILEADAYYWKKTQVDLSAFIGQQVYVAWRHYDCTDNYKLLLDSVSITFPSYVGLGENAKDRVNIFPNPFKDVLNINGADVSRIMISNILGQQVMDAEISEVTKLDVSQLNHGTYFVSIYKNDDLIETRKLVKR